MISCLLLILLFILIRVILKTHLDNREHIVNAFLQQYRVDRNHVVITFHPIPRVLSAKEVLRGICSKLTMDVGHSYKVNNIWVMDERTYIVFEYKNHYEFIEVWS